MAAEEALSAMSCEHTRAVLQGASPPVDVTEHLSSCPDCRALAQSLQDVDIPFAALPPPPVPAELLDAVRAELRAEIALEDALQALQTRLQVHRLSLLNSIRFGSAANRA